MMDRHAWIEVLEYLATAVAAVLMAVVLAENLGTPMWGGLSGVYTH